MKEIYRDIIWGIIMVLMYLWGLLRGLLIADFWM